MAKSKAADHHLWQRALADDPTAWEELVARHQAIVYTVAIRCGLSLADAADCFQQTWLALYKSRHHIQDANKLVAWLITTTRREAVRMRRKGDALTSLSEDLEAEQMEADRELEHFERQVLLRAALDQLKERDRHLVEMLFFSSLELSYEEIAAVLGVPLNSLGPMRHRCLAKLRKIIEAMELPNVRNRDGLPLLDEECQAGKEPRVIAFEPPGYY